MDVVPDCPFCETGSSPRPWGNVYFNICKQTGKRFIPTPVGKWHRPLLERLTFRFIPTPVGKCLVTLAAEAPSPVHPHARGEMHHHLLPRPTHAGSSPRPWGNDLLTPRKCSQNRFIPTPVGKWRPAAGAVFCRPVHPHARGEMFHGSTRCLQPNGSSPRPWGNVSKR